MVVVILTARWMLLQPNHQARVGINRESGTPSDCRANQQSQSGQQKLTGQPGNPASLGGVAPPLFGFAWPFWNFGDCKRALFSFFRRGWPDYPTATHAMTQCTGSAGREGHEICHTWQSSQPFD
ncbi:hypothetical protein BDQ94DRAFT_152176, partial [Aspergillus welwitschiae]